MAQVNNKIRHHCHPINFFDVRLSGHTQVFVFNSTRWPLGHDFGIELKLKSSTKNLWNSISKLICSLNL